MTTVLLGYRSQIAQEFDLLATTDEEAICGSFEFPELRASHYLICQGFISGKKITEQSSLELQDSWNVNYVDIVKFLDLLFQMNSEARVCVIGSASGQTGSYDMAYAGAKAALHLYIKTKKLSQWQQLVGIAPSIIENAGMTIRRSDRHNLDLRKEQHPKRRFLQAIEVARLAHFLLYQDEGYITGTVINMHGGEHSR